jgi:dolichol kinase
MALLFEKIFHPLLRTGEKATNLTGATYLFISVTVTFLVFEKFIAVPAVLILTVADSMAAIAGKLFGDHRIWNKSWEGTITFFIASFIILNIFFPGYVLYMMLVAAVLSLIEILPLPLSDNLWITLSAGIMLTLVN